MDEQQTTLQRLTALRNAVAWHNEMIALHEASARQSETHHHRKVIASLLDQIDAIEREQTEANSLT
jgi:hypothetical protein